MVDPIGVVSLGIQVVQGILWYYESYKSSDDDISGTCRTLGQLQHSLQLVKPYLTDHLTRQEVRQQIERCVLSSSDSLQKLEKKLVKMKAFTAESPALRTKNPQYGRVYRALYPFKRSTLLKLSEEASESQGQLHIALSALGL